MNTNHINGAFIECEGFKGVPSSMSPRSHMFMNSLLLGETVYQPTLPLSANLVFSRGQHQIVGKADTYVHTFLSTHPCHKPTPQFMSPLLVQQAWLDERC